MHRNVSDVWSYMFGFRQRECRKAGSAGLQTDERLEFYLQYEGINKEIGCVCSDGTRFRTEFEQRSKEILKGF